MEEMQIYRYGKMHIYKRNKLFVDDHIVRYLEKWKYANMEKFKYTNMDICNPFSLLEKRAAPEHRVNGEINLGRKYLIL